MTREEIARILKELRVSAGLTQSQSAQAIGRKQQTLASWETGQSQPDANTLFVLCALYGASVDEAFGFKKNKKSRFDLTPRACEVAQAYEAAEPRARDAVRLTLGLPPEAEQPPISRKALNLPSDDDDIRKRAEAMSDMLRKTGTEFAKEKTVQK